MALGDGMLRKVVVIPPPALWPACCATWRFVRHGNVRMCRIWGPYRAIP